MWHLWSPQRQPLTIGILSFNRPQYLHAVLTSLRAQVTPHDEIVLFQDGALNPFSGRAKASADDIQAFIALFRDLFPSGLVMESRHNLGIALNYDRAEKYFFAERDLPQALLLEDDLVLSPHYLAVISMLLGMASSDPRIAYVSAYGNLWAPLKQQRRHRKDLQHMHENWGFARTRQSWREEQDFRSQYMALVQDCDYSERDDQSIFAFYERSGWKAPFTSQDTARWIASVELGKIRLTTFACHARYIGAEGEHFSPEAYYDCGFDRTEMYDRKPAKLVAPRDSVIDGWLETERKRFRGEIRPFFYPGHGGS